MFLSPPVFSLSVLISSLYISEDDPSYWSTYMRYYPLCSLSIVLKQQLNLTLFGLDLIELNWFLLCESFTLEGDPCTAYSVLRNLSKCFASKVFPVNLIFATSLKTLWDCDAPVVSLYRPLLAKSVDFKSVEFLFLSKSYFPLNVVKVDFFVALCV